MEIELAIIVGVLFGAGVYMVLRRNMVKVIIGLVLMSHAANLLIFTAAGLTRGSPALVSIGETVPPEIHADPLPQALVLTAIVISFAVIAFALVLFKRAYEALETDDLDKMNSVDTT
jgi:multicomponent Na+:H+ antiporter subunit C